MTQFKRLPPKILTKIQHKRSSNGPIEGQRATTCYNCGNKHHFVADCHFERREYHGGRILRKDKSKPIFKGYTKYSSNKNLDSKKAPRKKPSAFVTCEEYSSNDDDEKKSTKEDEDAAVIATTTPSIYLFDARIENRIINSPRCLIAKVSLLGN
jgi:hypothetical protein